MAILLPSRSTAGCGSDPQPDAVSVDSLDDVGNLLAHYYFSRSVDIALYGTPVIPFCFTQRPTVTARVGDREYNLLFDTGTYTSILKLDSIDQLPPTIELSASREQLALLESKLIDDASGTRLDYGIAQYVHAAGFALRNVPFRLYTSQAPPVTDYSPQLDFQGAISPMLFKEWVIAIDNSTQRITMIDPGCFVPPAGCMVLPLLILPRGLFVPLELDGEMYWFHLDTGFSGSLGILETVSTEHQALFTASGEYNSYTGWQQTSSHKAGVLQAVTIRPYKALTWAGAEALVLKDVPAVLYPGVYGELSGYRVGGIAGSGFMQYFDYYLDIGMARVYLLRNEIPLATP